MTTVRRTPGVMTMLVWREFMEHRLLFVYWPLGCALFLMLLAAMALAKLHFDADVSPLLFPAESANPPATATSLQAVREGRGDILPAALYVLPEMLMELSFWLSMGYYFLFSLHQQRKDRSILFWNSLPVSGARTIIAKLVAGLVFCRLVYVASFLALEGFQYLAVETYAWLKNIYPLGADYLAQRPFVRFKLYLLNMPYTILWALPVYSWLLLASATVRRTPFAWAVGPPLLLILLEVALTERSRLAEWILDHGAPGGVFIALNDVVLRRQPGLLLELGVSVVLAAGFILAAIRFNRADDY